MKTLHTEALRSHIIRSTLLNNSKFSYADDPVDVGQELAGLVDEANKALYVVYNEDMKYDDFFTPEEWLRKVYPNDYDTQGHVLEVYNIAEGIEN